MYFLKDVSVKNKKTRFAVEIPKEGIEVESLAKFFNKDASMEDSLRIDMMNDPDIEIKNLDNKFEEISDGEKELVKNENEAIEVLFGDGKKRGRKPKVNE